MLYSNMLKETFLNPSKISHVFKNMRTNLAYFLIKKKKKKIEFATKGVGGGGGVEQKNKKNK